MSNYNMNFHRDKALENVSIAYRPGEFIADKIIPNVPVMKESDIYYVYSADIMTLPETVRANGAESNKASFSVSTSSYQTIEHAINDVVTMRDRRNADKAINPEVDVTEILTQKLLIRKEYEAAQLLQDANNWSNNASLTSTYAWSANTTLSNPITQIDSATSVLLKASGYKPNKLIIDFETFQAAKEHVSVIDRIKYTSADSVTAPMLSKLFNVAETLVGEAVYNSADEGLNASNAWIWTNCAFLAYFNPSPSLKKPSAAYNMQFSEGGPVKVFKWDEPRLGEGTIKIEVGSQYVYKAVATACAYLIKDTY